jgi:hypothetical protein
METAPLARARVVVVGKREVGWRKADLRLAVARRRLRWSLMVLLVLAVCVRVYLGREG